MISFLDISSMLNISYSTKLACADGASTDPFTGRPSAAATMAGVPFEKHGTVRIAIVGTGLRGRSVLHELLGVPNVRITALCDPVPEKVEMAVQQMRGCLSSEIQV